MKSLLRSLPSCPRGARAFGVILCWLFSAAGARAAPTWSFQFLGVAYNQSDTALEVSAGVPVAAPGGGYATPFVKTQFSRVGSVLPVTRFMVWTATAPAYLQVGTVPLVRNEMLANPEGLPRIALEGANAKCVQFIRASYIVNRVEIVAGGLAAFDISFSIECTSGGGSGRFVYEDPELLSGQLGVVNGLFWRDDNGDGIRAPGERGIPNAYLELRDPAERFIASAITDIDGRYLFKAPPGTYQIVTSLAPGLTLVPSNRGASDALDSDFDEISRRVTNLVVLAGASIEHVDAGTRDAYTWIEGVLWFDADRDGLREAGEAPLAHAGVFAQESPMTGPPSGITTDISGRYALRIAPGITARAQFSPRAGSNELYSPTLRDVGNVEGVDSDFGDSLASPDILATMTPLSHRFDGGFINRLAIVQGATWLDVTTDGIRQVGEPIAIGVPVAVVNARDEVIAQTQTDDNGRYSVRVTEGALRLRFGTPISLTTSFGYTLANRGSDDAVDSDAGPTGDTAVLQVAGDGTVTANVDAGFVPLPPGVVSGVAWIDSDEDGLRDPGEPPTSPSVEVLRNGFGITSGFADASGAYRFEVPSGSGYQVRFGMGSPGFTARGRNGANDSDAEPATGMTRPFSVPAAGEARRDAGYLPSGALRLADYAPFPPAAQWVYSSNLLGTVTDTVQIARAVVGGVTTTVLASSDGTSTFLTADQQGLRVHREVAVEGGVANDGTFAPPLLLLPAVFTPGQHFEGDVSFNLVVGAESVQGTLHYSTDIGQIETLSTPLGPMRALKVTFHTQALLPGEAPIIEDSEEWFVREIGNVKTFTPSDGEVQMISAIRIDADQDGRYLLDDNCPGVANADQRDVDGDWVGDACDLDHDDDQRLNDVDNCPFSSNFDQRNLDLDLRGDACDVDDDNDGMSDTFELTNGLNPRLADDAYADADADGFNNLLEAMADSSPQIAGSVPSRGAGQGILLLGTGPAGIGAAPLVDPLRITQTVTGGIPSTVFPTAGALQVTLDRNPALANLPAAGLDMRPVWCNLDGDPADELVIGLGKGSAGWLEIKDDAAHGLAHLRWLKAGNWTAYDAQAGGTNPACGDVDGDGRDELVVGYDRGGAGWMFLMDDALGNFAPLITVQGKGWLQRRWKGYNDANGSTYPAVGNLDADPRAEIAVGGGDGNRSWVVLLDDAASGFKPLARAGGEWVQGGAAAFDPTLGNVWPAICDVTGDGLGELLLGTRSGVQVLDPMTGMTAATFTDVAGGWLKSPYRFESSPASEFPVQHPGCGNLFGRAAAEVVVATADDSVVEIHASAELSLARVYQSSVGDPAGILNGWAAVGGDLPPDRDGDGVFDSADAFPDDPAESRDTDRDGSGDNIDPDDDNDGLSDAYETAHHLDPLNADGDQGASGDPDRDGLSNMDEQRLGGSPTDADSDDDGMDDGYEDANQFDTLHADATQDADGDGDTNLAEYKGGGDPRNAASRSIGDSVATLGLGAGGGGVIEIVGSSGRLKLAIDTASNPDLADYPAERRDARPVWCDVDGDHRNELVIGLGKGGRGWLEIKDDITRRYAHLAWIRIGAWPTYVAANGETFPACGDLDGVDTNDEIVVGLGAGSAGWIYFFDDAGTGFRAMPMPGNGWFQRPWDAYNRLNGELRPAVGNLDADSAGEIVLGGGTGNGGWIFLADYTASGIKPMTTAWAQTDWGQYNTASGAVWPAICPYDYGRKATVVLGLGEGGKGWYQSLDALNALRPVALPGMASSWLRIADAGYAAGTGEIRPVCQQGQPEAVELWLGYGARGAGKLERRGGTISQTDDVTYRSLNGAIWPAIDLPDAVAPSVTGGFGTL